MDRGRQEKTRPLDRELTKRKEDKERKILDLLEKRVSGRRGQTQRDKDRDRERGMMLFCQCFPVGTRLLVKKS